LKTGHNNVEAFVVSGIKQKRNSDRKIWYKWSSCRCFKYFCRRN